MQFRTFDSPGGTFINGVIYVNDPASGVFRPASRYDLGAALATTNFAIITGGQTTVPANALSWSAYVQSGAAYINGVGPYMAQMTVGGNNYVASPITIGGTGNVTSPTRIYVQYDVAP